MIVCLNTDILLQPYTVSKETKFKRVETILKMKKPQTKSGLEIQVKKWLEANDALEESNRKKIEFSKCIN